MALFAEGAVAVQWINNGWESTGPAPQYEHWKEPDFYDAADWARLQEVHLALPARPLRSSLVPRHIRNLGEEWYIVRFRTH